MRESLARSFAETQEEDERVAAEMKARLPEAVRLICAALGDRRVILYGSLATGLFFAAHSDVDLAVEGLGDGASSRLQVALQDLFGRKVDVVDPARVAPHVQRDIAERGVVVHEPGREG
jgi:predicted nucleotidyltransferase